MMYVLFFFLLLCCGVVQGKDLGTFGPTFPIEEEHLIQNILKRLKVLEEKGDLQKHQETIAKTVINRLHHLDSVKGISHTSITRTFTFDPSIRVLQDLKDHKGTVFFTKGTYVNPLHIRSLTKPLLFMDGDAPDHHLWLQKQMIYHPHAKVIFVKGDPFAWMEHYDFPVFYDQGGTLTSKMGIRHVPAKVTQEGELLRIDEEMACEDGEMNNSICIPRDGEPRG